MDGIAAQDGSGALSHVKGVVLLLDDVLFDRQDWLVPALCFASASLGMDPDRVSICIDEYIQQTGSADAGIYNHILLSFGQSDSVMNIRAFNAWVNRFSPQPGSMFMYPGVRDALQQLRYSHELSLLVQGNTESQKSIIAALDCGKYFSHITYADEIDGMRSRLPDDRAIRGLLSQMRLGHSEVALVGNNPHRHFETPNKLGCHTVRCMTGEYSRLDNELGPACAHYSISSAARLPKLLGVGSDVGSGLQLGTNGANQADSLAFKARA